MWCVSPQWPAHGRHLAVEFVHPVIVGKRALPAVYVDGDDIVGQMRLVARPGDIVATIGEVGERLADVLRRAEPWGLTSVCIGAGARPPAGVADHVLWVDDGDGSAPMHDGDVVLIYHLLWELTHVVFEHPGLLRAEPECTGDVCITCSDEGQLAEVTRVRTGGLADVVTGGEHHAVDVSLIEPVQLGDLVLVHAGVALTHLPREMA
jgi:hydrogenase maturation factor